MKKILFAISGYQELWDSSVTDLFIAEPYIYHLLEKNGETGKFRNIEVAPYRQQSSTDIIHDSDYVNKKYEKYIDILARRLNSVSGTNHKKAYWKKALSMAFLRYLTSLHDIFRKGELFFNSKEQTCNVLARSAYYIPLDFEDQRFLIQNTDYGFEQMFSQYINLFYPETFTEVDHRVPVFDMRLAGQSGIRTKAINVKQSPLKSVASNIIRIIKQSIRKLIYKMYSVASGRKETGCRDIQLGIVGSYFSEGNMEKLMSRSNGRIQPLDWRVSYNYEDSNISCDKRAYLSAFESDFDRFDKFFFYSIKYFMPRVFVEHYHEIESFYNRQLRRYPNLRFIVSEGWISNTYMSMFLALSQERNIKHITNEHNTFFHPYVGSFISHVISMSDIFVSLGWDKPETFNFVRGASLFPFVVEGEYENKYKILYVSGVPLVKKAHYVSVYGLNEENAPRHLAFVKAFFESLEEDTLQDITYRGYPKTDFMKFLKYDKEYILSPLLRKIKFSADTTEACKDQMRQSRLVIIDYTATSYLEALSMNIPTVFFWNPDTYYLKDEYSDFFQPLLDVGICQSNPVEAARFVGSIKDDPEKWWLSENVQKGKNEFMSRNMGNPKVMIEYLLKLVAQ